ncbi:N-acetylmuramic acid 6-phosphate etherase [Alteribacter aurantiacus]|uniref:N-acetylmuramic acid 6-phosphate etherase n=1 Tax=Alteribacter aurantiacus TaxID=254410 RepID=UPI000400B13F|nr:N-acetylmuramic acid 6-phosphate etherase [Alteribacter aurantiacus]
MELNLSSLTTEKRNERTKNIDQLSTKEIITLINKEDQEVANAVQNVIPNVEVAVKLAYESLKKGGRLIYIGAGTSGRLGIIDSSECPPTFRTSPGMVLGIMAGGEKAITTAVEGVEDDPIAGAKDLEAVSLSEKDTVVGIAASGRTPYVVGALKYAKTVGASTVALSANENAVISEGVDCEIEVLVGPEVLTGSTRLKAATAHKMVLNMISTATMIKLGKVYENLMVDVNASNYKLKVRAKNIVKSVTDVSDEKAEEVLLEANNDVKVAIVMIKGNTTVAEAKKFLDHADGQVRLAIEHSQKLR